MSKIDYGTIDIEIGEQTYTLKPTLAAYQKIDNRMGSLRQAIESCSGMSIDGLCFIIAAGAGIGQKEAKDLPEAVFQAGTINLLPKVTEYLVSLLNPSGRDPVADEEAPKGE